MASWFSIRRATTSATAPAAEPISTAQAKAFLRIDVSDQDTLIDELIASARTRVENDTGRSLITTTWDLTFDAFPTARAIPMPRLPMASISSITSYDDDDSASTMSSSDYLVDTAGGRVILNDDADWPTDLRAHNGGVIRFVAGYGSSGSDVPEPLRLATYQWLTHFYEHADPVGEIDAVNIAYAGLIAAYRNAAGIAS